MGGENALAMPTSLPEQWRAFAQQMAGGEVTACLEFWSMSHPDEYRKMVREFFFGGEERIEKLAAFCAEVKGAGSDLLIIPAGVHSAVAQALAQCVPELLPYFGSGQIYDTLSGRHRVNSIEGIKMLIM